MTKQRFLAGCLALATALSPLPAAGQARSIPPPVTAPTPVNPVPAITPQPAPALTPMPSPVTAPKPAPVARYESARGAESREYSFEDDTVDGALAKPEGAAVAAAPPDVPAYSDLCKASPKPPWCSDAPKGSGN